MEIKKEKARIENVDIPPKPEEVGENQQLKPKPLPVVEEKTKKQKLDEFNNHPNTINLGAVAISKKTYAGLWVALIVLITILAISVIWSNTNVSLGKMEGDINLNISENPIEVTAIDQDQINNEYEISIPTTNNITINIDLGDEIADNIASDVVDLINEITNSS